MGAAAEWTVPAFHASLYCIDPNGGDKPEFGKIDA
jgi:hypothetical protein